ncbi:MbcA/ParS/Xre antitoxin family protein [Vibrio aestuarianus]|uniref:antitoxin Xre/MbcA/ParS toxin-binding domain-containing protein n=1 Tax=Vibrio aestuarianus TaxID=28171 RepID=UPI00237D0D4F|nr:antitoxin Xre/MbcA/ParS toxin-binding domain-containing protein [Vibrio aestuarianus]MDE1326840.1 MbcA/ParS/Xre antitoxin family protein [Vibrio aestuarianus]
MSQQLDSEVKSRLMAIFNDEALCDEWLRNSKKPLGSLSPLEALKKADGKAKVLELITRIETGDFS